MANYRARLQVFSDLFEKDIIPFDELQLLCFNGIPDDLGYRPLCWKILLNYLPTVKSEWPTVLQKQRNLYDSFVEEMIVTPGTKDKAVSRIDVTLDDHPLNPNPDGKWMAYFKDNEVLLQINKDVRRLCPDISFFQQATEYPCTLILGKKDVETLRERVEQTVLRSANVTRNRIGITNVSLFKKRATEEYQHLSRDQEAHWEVVERILFIYAKLNPGQSYVQGMNEIIGPIYYAFASDPDPEWRTSQDRERNKASHFKSLNHLSLALESGSVIPGLNSLTHKEHVPYMLIKSVELKVLWLITANYHRCRDQEDPPLLTMFKWWREHAEADTFFCFTNLMSEIRDFFIKTLDESATGIGSMMKRLLNLLQEHDFDLWQLLQKQDIKPQYFSFRWITLLLSQEFPLPDLIRVWDSLFSDKNRFDFLIQLCCAMILWLREKLMQGDFSTNMKLLQNFPNVDIHCLIEKAVELKR